MTGKVTAILVLTLLALGWTVPASHAQNRRLRIDDLAAIKDVSDPQISPDGAWVAYVVRTTDVEADRGTADVWMVRWDGTERIQLTHTKESESRPRWSPDGRYLAFVSSRGGEARTSQVWLMARAGGEARQLTKLPGGVSDYAWSPDAKRLVLVGPDPEPEQKGDAKKTPPIVIDRYQFKQDVEGYLSHRREHLYVFDLGTEQTAQVTSGDYDDSLPSWSPDGSTIAFSSKRDGDPDQNENWDIFLVDAKAGAAVRKLTTFEGADNDPGQQTPAAWSPDGKSIAYLQGGPPKYYFYDAPKIAVIPVTGGPARLVTPALERAPRDLTWSADGRYLYFILEDDRNIPVVRVPAAGGAIEPVSPATGVFRGLELGPQGRMVATVSRPNEPAEVVAIEGGASRPLTSHNRDLLQPIALGAVEGVSFTSKDGTVVHGIVTKPPDYVAGRRYPTIVYIHGGAPVPFNQDAFEFKFLSHFLAANGYVVFAPNYRGSSGRNQAFTRAIFADWGHLEVQDVLAGVDYLVSTGLADPERMGIGGWSYGGMTTNYTIASDTRFKAAISGAGESNILATWGTDQYIRQYDVELGVPWKNLDTFMKISYPFFHADRIKTPTMFVCGEKDFNVPLLNSEQMYQALRELGVPTRLVIYPGQFHGLTKPSYLRDRFERYLAWYDQYVMGRQPAKSPAGSR
jgi:dipeptidyl aminopeptidase/acylaminoacyl peptidase